MPQPISLAIIGGGPNATYALERLAAAYATEKPTAPLRVSVFDRRAYFGDGEVHAISQPRTSYLNRVIAQVSFGTDDTIADAGPLLDPSLRPTFLEWSQQRFAETGDSMYDLGPADWTKRWVHGLALRESFERYLALLRSHPHVTVDLHHAEVTDVREKDSGFELIFQPDDSDPRMTGDASSLVADHVLFATGHTTNRADLGGQSKRLWEFAQASGTRYVHAVYPMNEQLDPETVPPGSVVGCFGLGLTAIDVILHLTEGRGGRFEPVDGERLAYHPSGREPRSIVAFSQTGVFLYARPDHDKERGDPTVLHHKGIFFTTNAVDQLRESVGVVADIPGFGPRRQIDFERHLMPIVALELATIYYRTLLGPTFGQRLEELSTPPYEAWLAGDMRPLPVITDSLTCHLEPLVSGAAELIDGVLAGELTYGPAAAQAAEMGWELGEALQTFVTVLFDDTVGAEITKQVTSATGPVDAIGDHQPQWGHPRLLRENVFDWDTLLRPIPTERSLTPEDYRAAVLDFMDRDHAWARQGDIRNPFKAMTDGGMRDLQAVASSAVDFGGLTAASHRWFYINYGRYRKRLAIGTALEVMERIRALVAHGILDVGAGPDAAIEMDADRGRFVVHGPVTGMETEVDVLVDAKVHTFQADRQEIPLYPNMLRSGLVRKWRNPSADGRDFEPGGLDVDEHLHPYRADGSVVENLTFLGPPGEGALWLQVGAARPNYNHMVLRDIARWFRDFHTIILTPLEGSHDRAVLPHAHR